MNKIPEHPPRLGLWLLRWLCREEYRDEVAGDLEEVYQWRLSQGKGTFARFRYFLDVFSAIRFFKGGKSLSKISNAMLFSFVKSSFRSLRRHSGYTLLNILGLSVGLMVAIYILEYTSHELSYNQSARADQIYRVSNDYYRYGKLVYNSSQTFPAVGPGMVENLPEAVSQARLYNADLGWGGATILTHPEQPDLKAREPDVYFADPAITCFFDLDMVAGKNDLSEPNTAILSVELAEKYFGNIEKAVGSVINYNDDLIQLQLKVTGVYTKPGFNLQIDLDALISYQTLSSVNADRFENNWRTNSVITFVELQPGTDVNNLETELEELALQFKPDYQNKDDKGEFERINHFFLMPIADIHLYSEFQNELGPVGDATTVNMLLIISVFITVIAWINFINLSTARSLSRAREVAVRKVIGANRRSLTVQFFIEALLINLLALVLAIGLVLVFQSFFNSFVELDLQVRQLDFERFGLIGLLIFTAGTLLSGLYPAFMLAAFPAYATLQKSKTSRSGIILRRALISFQLLFSFLLIIATLTMRSQLEYMNSQDLGFDPEQVLVMKGPTIRQSDGAENQRLLDLFKQRLQTMPTVSSAGSAGTIPGIGILRGIVLNRVKEGSDLNSIERLVVDKHFLSTLGMNFLAGGDFHERPNEENPIIITESAALQLGFSGALEALDETIFEFGQEERKVVGVLEDFHQESLEIQTDPMYFIRNERVNTYLVARLSRQNVAEALSQVEDLYQELFPGNPIESYFLDDFFGRQYERNELNRKVFGGFALVAIFVAALGLYGLSSYSALKRTKEIGVRKVLGATIPSLFLLLAREVFVLVAVGFLLAVPLAYYGLETWLQGFAYRMDLQVWLFAVPLVMILIITTLAVLERILNVAMTNPTRSLRNE